MRIALWKTGSEEKLSHVWMQGDKLVDVIPLLRNVSTMQSYFIKCAIASVDRRDI